MWWMLTFRRTSIRSRTTRLMARVEDEDQRWSGARSAPRLAEGRHPEGSGAMDADRRAPRKVR